MRLLLLLFRLKVLLQYVSYKEAYNFKLNFSISFWNLCRFTLSLVFPFWRLSSLELMKYHSIGANQTQ